MTALPLPFPDCRSLTTRPRAKVSGSAAITFRVLPFECLNENEFGFPAQPRDSILAADLVLLSR